MAFLVGIVSQEELEELERRGWETEEPPNSFLAGGEYKDGPDRDGVWVMFWVDNSLFNIMSGPDWDKAEETSD